MSVCYLFVLLVVLQSHALTAVVLQVVAGGDLQSNKTFMTALMFVMFVMFVMLKAQLHTRLETNHPSDGLLLLTLDLRVRFFFSSHHGSLTSPFMWLHMSQRGMRARVSPLPSSRGIWFCRVITEDTAHLVRTPVEQHSMEATTVIHSHSQC